MLGQTLDRYTIESKLGEGGMGVVEGGIYHIERAPGGTRLMYFDLSTQQSTMIASNLGNVGLGLTATPDGRSILF